MPEGGEARIAAAFARAREQGRAALMPYLMAGFPDLDSSREVLAGYLEGGADLVELGVPYSDPLADGPVIHAAGTRALAGGTTFADALELCAEVSARVPVLPMVYANMALARGAERFAGDLAEAGACGAIVPDLPPGEESELPAALAARGLALIRFISPTTPAGRRARLLADAVGFVYLVSLAGVTGERRSLPAELTSLIRTVRAEAQVPVAVGFGIGSPERAAEVGAEADGVIVGSRLVRIAGEAGDAAAIRAGVARFLRQARERMSTGPS